MKLKTYKEFQDNPLTRTDEMIRADSLTYMKRMIEYFGYVLEEVNTGKTHAAKRNMKSLVSYFRRAGVFDRTELQSLEKNSKIFLDRRW